MHIFFRKAFYGVSYTDYLFSLPMGTGKTYLMAAFIYLDLYFAGNEPSNPAFAHNFIILAPSGLKSSIVPSLKTIQRFDPSWVIPEPAASSLKRQISFRGRNIMLFLNKMISSFYSAVSRQTAWAAVRNVLTSFFSGSGRWPQSRGRIKRFSAFY